MNRSPPDGDPLARQSPFLFWAFGWYIRWFCYRRFHAVRIARAGLPDTAPGRPVIVFGNHPSWWDPALYILLQTKLFPGRTGFGPMDAASLGRYGVFRRMGVFGIEPGTRRGAAAFLSTSLRVLSTPQNMLWITAEGGFNDPRTRPVRLRPGLAHLVRRIPCATVLPLALEYGFWNESRPEALARFGAPVTVPHGATAAAITACLEDALARTMDALAQDSIARDPRLFLPLLRGGTGVGGIYDLYRRTRALAAGQRFDPSHGRGE